MAVKERRTTHFEWTCDGPFCEVVERIFERNGRPEGWLTLKVTRETTKAFHTRGCANAYFADSLDDGLDQAAPPTNSITISTTDAPLGVVIDSDGQAL